jgi:hypothetical protein
VAFDDNNIYGYGRREHKAAGVGHRANATHLFASVKEYGAPRPEPKADQKGKKQKTPAVAKDYIWSTPDPLITRAMVLTQDNLYIAGIPDPGKKDDKNAEILQYTNPDEAIKAFQSDKDACIRVISKSDGKITSEVKLEVAPVFDGMSAAGGNLFVSLKNGKVICFGK